MKYPRIQRVKTQMKMISSGVFNTNYVHMKNVIKIYMLILLPLFFMTVSCVKETTFFSEPYGEGKAALGVVFDPSQTPSPANGGLGTVVTFKVEGLQDYLDKAVFKFNGQEAKIIGFSGDKLQVEVPAYGSKGVTSITIDDIVIFGPDFEVNGKIKVDPTWEATRGTNGAVNNTYYLEDGTNKMIFLGRFTDYNQRGLVKPINRLVRTFSNGTYDVSWGIGEGANGTLNTIAKIDNRYYLGGSFSGYDQKRENISNLTSIHLTGGLDSVGITPFRRPDQLDTTKYVPTFNGGFNSAVSDLYVQDQKLIATGNFRYYVSRRYDQPNERETRDTTILDSVEIRQVARLNLDGTLDKTFRFSGNKALAGANGDIKTFLHKSGALEGKILVYGQFTTFDGEAKGYITRLNADGTVDATFNPSGTGANYYIGSVSYNEQTNKYIIAGQFRNYNGQSAYNMALLNADGTLDKTFDAKTFQGGYPTFVKQLNDGLIVVSGGFQAYGGIMRSRFMILNPDGSLADPELNATGQFNGTIYRIEETKSEDNKRALLIMGDFSKFDNEDVSNLIRVIIE